jgi:hypothetical protein
VAERVVPEEEPEFDPRKIQANVPVSGQIGPYDRNTSRGSGQRAWIVASTILFIALLISAGILFGWFGNGELGTANNPHEKETISASSTILPEDRAILYSNNLTLVWSPVQDAVNYQILIDREPSFSNPLLSMNISGNSKVMSLADGHYCWKVMVKGQTASSNWTSTRSFDVRTGLDNITLLLPSNGSVVSSTSESFGWSAVSNAESYRLQISDKSDFSMPVIDVLTTEPVYLANFTFVNSMTYKWRVMAIEGSIGSGWSNSSSFTARITLTTPALMGPGNGSTLTSNSILLNWTDVPGAFIYRLQIDVTSDFSSPVIDLLSMSSAYQISGLQPNSTYYWRVIASNEHYQSPWSSTGNFFKGFAFFLEAYTWNYNGHTFGANLNISGDSYYAAREQNRMIERIPYTIDSSAHVLSNDPALRALAAEIKKDADSLHFDSRDRLNLALRFVQSIPYGLDHDTVGFVEYVRYPIETLVDGVGDCDCKSVLFLALVQTMELSYDGVLLEYHGTTAGHMAVGVAGAFTGASYPYLGHNYFYCETTNSGNGQFLVGVIPNNQSGLDFSSAMVIPA